MNPDKKHDRDFLCDTITKNISFEHKIRPSLTLQLIIPIKNIVHYENIISINVTPFQNT